MIFYHTLNSLKIIYCILKRFLKCMKHTNKSVVLQIGTIILTAVLFRTSANKLSLNLDYLPYLRKFLTTPLVVKENDGIPEVIDLMDKYDIIKEDFDNILEVTKWPNSDDPMSQLSSKVSVKWKNYSMNLESVWMWKVVKENVDFRIEWINSKCSALVMPTSFVEL